MSTFLAYEHSHPYWMVNDAVRTKGRRLKVNREAASTSRAMPQPGVVPDAKTIHDLGLPLDAEIDDETNIHVIVPNASARSKAKGIVSHVWSNIPSESFVRVDNEFYVSSPESCFIQLAGRYRSRGQCGIAGIAHLTEYGIMLCGTYAVDPITGKSRYNRPPLTSVARLKRYLDRANGTYGITIARRAAQLVLDKSGSPLEAKAVMLLCFPPTLGGYGLPRPILNRRVDLTRGLWDRFGKHYYVCDAYWAGSKQRIIMEVDSTRYHTGKLRICADTEKRNNLGAMGIQVFGATAAQMDSPTAVERLAKTIAKSVGYQIRSSVPDLWSKREKLWNCLMGRYQAEFLDKGIGNQDY